MTNQDRRTTWDHPYKPGPFGVCLRCGGEQHPRKRDRIEQAQMDAAYESRTNPNWREE